MKVFLDANILFSAALSKSRMREFLDCPGQAGECVTNPYAIEEARRNSQAKFPAALPSLEAMAVRFGLISIVITDLPVSLALKDQPILSGAVARQADYLLTGDEKGFGQLFGKTITGVKVISPKMLAHELMN